MKARCHTASVVGFCNSDEETNSRTCESALVAKVHWWQWILVCVAKSGKVTEPEPLLKSKQKPFLRCHTDHLLLSCRLIVIHMLASAIHQKHPFEETVNSSGSLHWITHPASSQKWTRGFKNTLRLGSHVEMGYFLVSIPSDWYYWARCHQ